jgi:hypothetical protein
MVTDVGLRQTKRELEEELAAVRLGAEEELAAVRESSEKALAALRSEIAFLGDEVLVARADGRRDVKAAAETIDWQREELIEDSEKMAAMADAAEKLSARSENWRRQALGIGTILTVSRSGFIRRSDGDDSEEIGRVKPDQQGLVTDAVSLALVLREVFAPEARIAVL